MKFQANKAKRKFKGGNICSGARHRRNGVFVFDIPAKEQKRNAYLQAECRYILVGSLSVPRSRGRNDTQRHRHIQRACFYQPQKAQMGVDFSLAYNLYYNKLDLGAFHPESLVQSFSALCLDRGYYFSLDR